jgi:hypothetical protein
LNRKKVYYKVEKMRNKLLLQFQRPNVNDDLASLDSNYSTNCVHHPTAAEVDTYRTLWWLVIALHYTGQRDAERSACDNRRLGSSLCDIIHETHEMPAREKI